MQVELSRTYPVPRRRGFEYFMDVRSWSDWTTLEVLASESTQWQEPGDTLRYLRRSALPGFRLDGEATLDEVTPDELVRMTLATRGLPEMPIECRFSHAGSSAFTLTLTVDTDNPSGFLMEALQMLLFLENQTARDMRRCLDGLEEVLTKQPVS